jgi:NADH-quinone oxidoreductase subunit M
LNASNSLPFLSALVWTPFIGALLLYLFPKGQGSRVSFWLTLVVTFIELGLSLGVAARFTVGDGGLQLTEQFRWIEEIGVWYALGIDGISLSLLLLTVFLTPIILLVSSPSIRYQRDYFAAFLCLEGSVVAAILALDLFLFYLAWELMLIPAYFLIGIWGEGDKLRATQKFLVYTVGGSIFMLVAILYTVWTYADQSGEVSFLFRDLLNVRLTSVEQWWLYGAFALAMAVKIPLFPFHTWLPTTYSAASPPVAAFLAGVLSKMGLYGLVRFALPLFPLGGAAWADVLAVLAVMGIIYGALIAWIQTDFVRLISFSSISHLGFCVLGAVVLNGVSTTGLMVQMVSHGLTTAALFLIAGMLIERVGSRDLVSFGGLSGQMPLAAVMLMLVTLAAVSLPFTSSFVGEFLILGGAFNQYPVLVGLALMGVILSAVYMLHLYKAVMFGPRRVQHIEAVNTRSGSSFDISVVEITGIVPVIFLVIFIGCFPQYLIDVVRPSVNVLIKATERRGRVLDRYDRYLDRNQRGHGDDIDFVARPVSFISSLVSGSESK